VQICTSAILRTNTSTTQHVPTRAQVPPTDPSVVETNARIAAVRDLLATERVAGRYTHAPRPIARSPKLRLAIVGTVVGALGTLYMSMAQLQQEKEAH
jgi:hypothetical protein